MREADVKMSFWGWMGRTGSESARSSRKLMKFSDGVNGGIEVYSM